MPNRKGVKSATNTCDTSPKTIMRREKMAQALKLRRTSMDFRSIGREIGVSYQTAKNYIDQAMREITEEDARKCRGLLLYQLDGLIGVHYPTALAGDLAATREVRNLLRERGQLLGLYPQGGGGVHVNVGGGDTQVNHVILGVPPIYRELPDGSTVRVSDGKVVSPARPEGMTPFRDLDEAALRFPRRIEHDPNPVPPPPARRPEAAPPTREYNAGPPAAYASSGLNAPRVGGNPAPYMPPQPTMNSYDGPPRRK